MCSVVCLSTCSQLSSLMQLCPANVCKLESAWFAGDCADCLHCEIFACFHQPVAMRAFGRQLATRSASHPRVWLLFLCNRSTPMKDEQP